MTVAATFMAKENENPAKLTYKVLSLERAQSSSLKCHTSPPKTRGGAGERERALKCRPVTSLTFGNMVGTVFIRLTALGAY